MSSIKNIKEILGVSALVSSLAFPATSDSSEYLVHDCELSIPCEIRLKNDSDLAIIHPDFWRRTIKEKLIKNIPDFYINFARDMGAEIIISEDSLTNHPEFSSSRGNPLYDNSPGIYGIKNRVIGIKISEISGYSSPLGPNVFLHEFGHFTEDYLCNAAYSSDFEKVIFENYKKDVDEVKPNVKEELWANGFSRYYDCDSCKDDFPVEYSYFSKLENLLGIK